MIPDILSGGSGPWLWPLSRKRYSKQILPLVKNQVTLRQDTLIRLEGVDGLNRAVLVLQADHVVCDDETRLVTENESVYPPPGCLHRFLKNPGRISLHLIDVQTGARLDKDDIVRLDDSCHR